MKKISIKKYAAVMLALVFFTGCSKSKMRNFKEWIKEKFEVVEENAKDVVEDLGDIAEDVSEFADNVYDDVKDLFDGEEEEEKKTS